MSAVDIDQGGGVISDFFSDLLCGSLGVLGTGTVNNCYRFHFVVVTVITTLNTGKMEYVYFFCLLSEKKRE